MGAGWRCPESNSLSRWIFQGKKAMMAAVYSYPKGAKMVPGLVQIYGGGGSGTEGPDLANAKEGSEKATSTSAGTAQAAWIELCRDQRKAKSVWC